MQLVTLRADDPNRKLALFIHMRCHNVEWWDESRLGPINDQGCDTCESAPDGGWRPVYIPRF